MLHILWVILKVLLIILAILLGIVLVLIAVILFCPIRYRVRGYKQGKKLYGQVGVSWLFHVVSARLQYQDKKQSLQIRILGISLESYKKLISRFHSPPKKLEEKKSGKTGKRKSENQDFIEQQSSKKNSAEKESRGREKQDAVDVLDVPSENSWSSQPELSTQVREASENDLGASVSDINFEDDSEEIPAAGNSIISVIWSSIKKVWSAIGSLAKGIFRKFMGMISFIYHIPMKIRDFFRKLALTYRQFCVNIEKWKIFLEDERTRAAFSLGWGELIKLLRHIGPTKVEGTLTFGFEDPSLTGQVLALIGATCPIHKNRITIEPVFDEKILKVDIAIKGRVYLFLVLQSAVKLYFDKNIKFMMKAMRKED